MLAPSHGESMGGIGPGLSLRPLSPRAGGQEVASRVDFLISLQATAMREKTGTFGDPNQLE
jgi:hypothetical protein